MATSEEFLDTEWQKAINYYLKRINSKTARDADWLQLGKLIKTREKRYGNGLLR